MTDRLLRGLRARGTTAVAALAMAGAGLMIPSAAHAADSTSFCADGSVPMVPVDTIESTYDASTQVTGLSVESGTTPTQFTGSYLGKIKDGIGKDKDLLLFKLSDPTIDGTGGLEPAGIWAGMSGSPVYDSNGALIGAVSYSLNGDNLPVAGVTPAAYMKTIGTAPVSAPDQLTVTKSNLVLAGGARTRAKSAKSVKALTTRNASLHQIDLVNLASGTSATSKLNNKMLARIPKGSSPIADRLRSGSFRAAGTPDPALDQPLVPGGNIAVTYATGDALAGSIGTVTAVCGNDVYAFGHPMDLAGRVTLGMSNASAALIVPDKTGTVGSYKQVDTFGDLLGRVTEDRLVGVKGTVDPSAANAGYQVSLDVTKTDGTVDSRKTRVLSTDAGPGVTANLIGNALVEDLDQYAGGTLELAWSIDYTTASGTTGRFTNSQLYAYPSSVVDYAAEDVPNDLYTLTDNPFTDVTVTGVHVTAKLKSQDSTQYRLARAEVKSGSTWSTLASKKLKRGKSYSVRPVYTQSVNGKVSGPTITGDARTMTIGKTTLGASSLTLASVNNAYDDDYCEDDFFCDDYDEDTGYEAATFSELLAQMRLVPNTAVLSTEVYTKPRKTTKKAAITAPGFVLGKVKASFTVVK